MGGHWTMLFQVTAFNVTGLQPDTKYKVQVSEQLPFSIINIFLAKSSWVVVTIFAPKVFLGLLMMMVDC